MSRTRAPRLRLQDLPPEMREAMKKSRRQEAAEEQERMVRHFVRAGLPAPTPEHPFSPPRRWRLDLAWPAHRLALEVEGGVWTGGRHTRGSGFLRDMEKYNALATMGWRLLRVVPAALYEMSTVDLVRTALAAPPPYPPPSVETSAPRAAGPTRNWRSGPASR